MNPNTPKIEMTAIVKRFGNRLALNEASLTLNSGEILGLVGDNGAGKSTLMKILSGAIERDQGSVSINGIGIKRLTPHISRSLGIEMVYQDLSLCENMTIWENIFLGKYLYLTLAGRKLPVLDKASMRRSALASLHNLGLELSDINQQARKLSGGQRQAVAICRAMTFNPSIVLLDEPTASMALKEQKKILKMVREIRNRGTSVIMISHDIPQLITVADRVLVLKSGQTVWETGSENIDPDELIRRMFIN